MGKLSSKMSVPPAYEDLYPGVDSFSLLPDELKSIIFSLLSIQELKEVCLVCREWYDIAMDPGTMEQALVNDGSIEPGLGLGQLFETSLEWRRLREVNPFKGNLLKNPNFSRTTAPWRTTGDYTLEGPEVHGAQPLPVEAECDLSTNKAVVTSYTWFHRSQSINLTRIPKIQKMFDLYKVYVCWSVWIAPRFDCSSVYKSHIEPRNNNYKQPQSPATLSDVSLAAGTEWEYHTKRVKLDRSSEIVYAEKGKDSQFWAGHYGVKIFNPTIRLMLQRK